MLAISCGFGTRIPSVRSLGLPATSAGCTDVVESDGAAAEKDERERESGQGEREFVPAVAEQSVVEVHFGDGDGQIDADGESGYAGEQAHENEQAPKEFSKGGEIGSPGWEPQ